MENSENNGKSAFWNLAGIGGLALGGLSSAYLLISYLLTLLPSGNVAVNLISSLGGVALWIAKIVACLALLKYFLKRYASTDTGIGNGDVFRFGSVVAILSALIYAGFYMAYVTYFAPDTFSAVLELMADNPMVTEDALSQMEELIPRLPVMSFFMNFIYCAIFGTVASAIYSRNIPSSNPFEGGGEDVQNQ